MKRRKEKRKGRRKERARQEERRMEEWGHFDPKGSTRVKVSIDSHAACKPGFWFSTKYRGHVAFT